MSSDEPPVNRPGDAQPRIGQWKNFQNPHPELPNPHLSQKPQVSLTREELRVLQECNRESFWYRSMPACLFCIGATQFAVTKGYLKPHPKYGAGLKTLGAALLGYILGKISYQNECRQKIMALPNSQLAETLRQRQSRGRFPSDFATETSTGGTIGSHDTSLPSSDNNTAPDILYDKPDHQIASDTAKFENYSTGTSGEQDQLYKSYGDLRRQNREVYQENQVVKWQNIPNRPKTQQPITSQTPEDDNTSQYFSSTKQRGPKNQYGDVWEE